MLCRIDYLIINIVFCFSDVADELLSSANIQSLGFYCNFMIRNYMNAEVNLTNFACAAPFGSFD